VQELKATVIYYLLSVKKILLIACIFIPLLVFLFYWYEWRPSKIRQDCDSIAWRISGDFDEYDWKYSQCLHNKGLK
jgi:hypothetical protein